eukprot:1153215-Pelagomonas_calceolata.AAC.8
MSIEQQHADAERKCSLISVEYFCEGHLMEEQYVQLDLRHFRKMSYLKCITVQGSDLQVQEQCSYPAAATLLQAAIKAKQPKLLAKLYFSRLNSNARLR